MSTQTALELELYLYLDSGVVDATNLVSNVTWSGDTQQASRSIAITLMNTVDGQKPLLDIPLATAVSLHLKGSEVFRGFIFNKSMAANGQMSLTAYDGNYYLTKSTDSKKFVNKKASDIITTLCKEFGISYGHIEDTGYIIPKLILRDKTIWDMMITALTYTRKQTGRKFAIMNEKGKLVLRERKSMVTTVNLERFVNITDSSYSISMDELKTRVKVVATQGSDSNKSEITYTAEDKELINKYGILQHLENVSGDMTKSQIQQRAKELLKELAVFDDEAIITAIGIPSVLSGTAVYVYEPMIGAIGGYYVIADSHTFSNGLHTMQVSLSATDELPTMDYEPPTE